MGCKALDIDECKLWYSGGIRRRNGIGVSVDRELMKEM